MFDLDDLRAKNPIDALIEGNAGKRDFKPREGGKVLRGYCPFHGDGETPSFDVWPGEWRWRCWGSCGEGGDGIDFMIKWNRLPNDKDGFKEACRLLGGVSSISQEESTRLRQQRDDERRQRIEAQNKATAELRAKCAEEQIWRFWHSRMDDEHLAYWTQTRLIPADYVAHWQLGYSPDIFAEWYGIDNTDIELAHRSAYTIPYMLNGQFQTMQFRYIVPNGMGKYHFAKNLGTAPFVVNPDTDAKKVILHEGALKSITAFLYGAGNRYQVVGFPSEQDWKCVIPLLGKTETVWVWGDPGSWIPPEKSKDDPSWLAHPVRLAKAIKDTHRGIDVRVVDFGRSDDFHKVDDMLLRGDLDEQGYLDIINKARPLHRLRAVRH